jgi:unsaturated chondroitin disaccharide hydrolase
VLLPDGELDRYGGAGRGDRHDAARRPASADFRLAQTPTCGVVYGDTGAPGPAAPGGYLGGVGVRPGAGVSGR